MKHLFIFVLCVAGNSLLSQNRYIDSLKTRLTTEKEDTERVFLYTDIADELVETDFKKSLEYAGKGLALAEKIGFKKGVAQAYAAFGNAYINQSNYEQCLSYNNKALEIRRQLGDPVEIAASLNNIGNVYNNQGNFSKALEYYLQCQSIEEKANNKEMLAKLYNNIGTAYANKGDLKNSIIYLFKSLKLKEEMGNKEGAANTCNNLAVIFKMQGNYPQALHYNVKALRLNIQLTDTQGIGYAYENIGLTYRNLQQNDSAELYLLKGLGIFSRIGFEKGVATAHNNLGIIYKTKKQYDKASAEYASALKIFQSENDKMGIATAMSNLASVYGKKGNRSEAQKYFSESEKIAKETGSYEVLMEMYDLYSVFNEDNNDFKNALKYHLLYTEARDSLRSQENSTIMAEVKTRYETNIKEKENENLKNESQVKDLMIEKKNAQHNTLIILFALALFTGTFLYNRSRLKQKHALAEERLYQQELRSNAVIKAEEKERTRIARELHDGIGQQLSAAKLNISGLQASIKTTNPDEITMINNAMELLDESVKEVRAVSHSMIPNALLQYGLVSAVREFINKISSAASLKINLEIVGLDQSLEPTVETLLFRILQEVVNNIIKHAAATEVGIQFIKHDKELVLLVQDNGIGFDPDEKLNDTVGGIGLKNIRSRVDFLHGEVIFDSYPGKGTTVTIEIPLTT